MRGSIEAHAARLAAKARELDEDAAIERLHFVGHSMGAIVVRIALTVTRPRKLGRVVLLAPPNRGARLADFALRLFGRRLIAHGRRQVQGRTAASPDGLAAGQDDAANRVVQARYEQQVDSSLPRLRARLMLSMKMEQPVASR